MPEEIQYEKLDEERALYGRENINVLHCQFDGPADGESALKECRNVYVEDCYFNLRYPLWHVEGLTLKKSMLTELCRAALWYSNDVKIFDTKLHGIKALRECREIKIQECNIQSSEFGWSAKNVQMENTIAESEYFMLRAENLNFRNIQFTGKYSFQYVQNAVLEDCVLNTKDAFWHAENVTVRNSVIQGEYLAWYSKNLHLINCRIIGTQPLCYCEGLVLENCEMEDTDYSFERSCVEARVITSIKSVKNPLSGHIYAPAVEEIIFDLPSAKGKVIVE